MARRGSVLIGAVVGALATMLLGGIAWAAIPSTPGGVIQGCYDAGGNVKVVEALPCPSKYTPFQWNQQGPAGTNGTNGTDGTNGTNGTNGQDGTHGQNGVSGYEVIESTIIDFPPGANSMRGVTCPLGKKAIGGGVSAGLNGVVTRSAPVPLALGQPNIWTGGVKNTSATEATATQVWAVCAIVD